jgi:hypothetical protein
VAEALDYRKAGFQPELKLSFSTQLDSDAAWLIDAKVDTVSFPSRNRNLAVASSLIIKHDASGEIRTITVKEGKGTLEGNATINKGAKGLDVPLLNSTLDWIGILRDLPVMAHSLDSLTVTKAPLIELSGFWSLEDPKTSAMNGTIKGLDATWTTAPMAPAAGGKAPAPLTPLVATQAEATVDINNGVIDFKTGSATLADGPVTFDFGVSPFETGKMPWTATIAGENLSLAQLTSAFAGTKIEGTAMLSFSGLGDVKPASLNGEGKLAIVASQSLKIPVVGPLIDLLSTVIPNLLKTESDRLQGSFLIKEGVMSTEDLTVGLSAAQVTATGTMNLVNEETKFQASANLRGPLQRFTPGLGDVLAVEGGGPIKKVSWKFKNFQGASSLGELIRGIRQPAAAPGAPGTVAPSTGATAVPAPGASATTPPAPTSKADELLRTVDQIGGLLKGIKGELKPATPAPKPAPANP